MKLIARYNRSFFPALFLLFLVCILFSFYGTRKVLQEHVDESLLRAQSRVVSYMNNNQALPEINTFDDLKLTFSRTGARQTKPRLESTMMFIPEQHKDHIARSLVFTYLLKDQNYRITISTPLEGIHSMTRIILLINIVTFFAILLIIVLISRLLLSRLWKPFYQSLQLVSNFKVDKNQGLRFPETDIEEFGTMIHHFQQATNNATRDYRQLKEFTENASHEIQTPLATIRSKLDLLAQQEDLSETQSEILQDTFSAVTRLTRLNQSLLLLAKIENDQFEGRTKLDFEEKLQVKISQFQELWQNSEIHCDVVLHKSEIVAHQDLVDILLNNILSNATRHNVPGGIIRIELNEKALTVSNTGQLKALDEDKLFSRFYKESEKAEHNGLGLSIVRQICDSNQVKVTYQFAENLHSFHFQW